MPSEMLDIGNAVSKTMGLSPARMSRENAETYMNGFDFYINLGNSAEFWSARVLPATPVFLPTAQSRISKLFLWPAQLVTGTIKLF